MDSMTGKKEAEETYSFETSQHVIISVALCRTLLFMGRFQKRSGEISMQTVHMQFFFLEKSNAEQQTRQRLDIPVRQVLEDAWLQHIPAAEEVANRYADLDYVVCSLENYEYLYLDESIYVPSQFKTTYERRLLTECEALCTNKYADV